jgi:hypothetical protein
MVDEFYIRNQVFTIVILELDIWLLPWNMGYITTCDKLTILEIWSIVEPIYA